MKAWQKKMTACQEATETFLEKAKAGLEEMCLRRMVGQNVKVSDTWLNISFTAASCSYKSDFPEVYV
jgi:hypothetical protein